MSEDPNYALEHNKQLNTEYYFKNKLMPPLRRLFKHILTTKQMRNLFEGDHIRRLAIATPIGNAGIMRFARKKLTCVRCKRNIRSGAMCNVCIERNYEQETYEKILGERNFYETLYTKAWTYCQRCQESVHSEILCSNDDCPIFYMRTEVRKELQSAQATLDRFPDIEDW